MSLSCRMRCKNSGGFKHFPFRGIHRVMLCRIVLEPDQKYEAPNESQCRKTNESPSPAEPIDAKQCQRRCCSATPSRESPHERLCSYAFSCRQPRTEHF